MINKKVYIVCNGEMNDYKYYKILIKDSYLICVDGGTRHFRNLGLNPDIIIGDFDSTFVEDLKYFENKGCMIEKLEVEKDKTDTHIALDFAINKGFYDITILGAIGSRIDHTLANINLLEYAFYKKVMCRILNENNEILLIDKKITLEGNSNWNLSLIPLTECVEGVTTKGLYYPLKESTLKKLDSLGISNVFSEKTASVEIKKGLLLVIKAKD
jgi:thiamine pyrophosphokinase